MARVILSVAAGFIAWLVMWLASEKIIGAAWPAFGAHQQAFQAAVENGGEFMGQPPMLFTHIILGSIVSMLSGLLAAVISGDNSRVPLYVGIALLALGILKAVLSWPYVPIWYQVIFTAILLPMAVAGGKLYTVAA